MLESQGEIVAARESYAKSQRTREQLAAAHPDNAELVRDVAVAQEKMGNVLTSLGDLTGTVGHRRASLEIFQRLAEADARNVQAQRSLAISHIPSWRLVRPAGWAESQRARGSSAALPRGAKTPRAN